MLRYVQQLVANFVCLSVYESFFQQNQLPVAAGNDAEDCKFAVFKTKTMS